MTHFLACSVKMMPVLIFVLVIVIFLPSETPVATNVVAGREDGNQAVEMMSSREDLVNWAGYGEENLSIVTVTGRVACGDPCYTSPGDKRAQLRPTLPVSGATVAIFCGTESRKSWARGSTDEYGDFSVEVPSNLHAIPNLDKVCSVNLLHLPKDSLCTRQPITGKQMIKGIKLLSIEDGTRAYVAETMHLKPRSSKACKFAGSV